MIAPPMVVFQYQRLPPHVVNSLPEDWGVGKSENGWKTGETFFEYVTNVHLMMMPLNIENTLTFTVRCGVYFIPQA